MYTRMEGNEEEGKCQGLKILVEEGMNIPVATWDPDGAGNEQEENDTEERKYSKLAEPMRVTLDKGDILYLPALWQVKSRCSSSRRALVDSVKVPQSLTIVF